MRAMMMLLTALPGILDRWILIRLSILMLHVKFSVEGPHEERLIDDIFNERKYQRLARPVEHETDNLEVKFGLVLQQIIEVDEKNEMLHTSMWLNYEWTDYKLTWNESEYGGITSIRLPSSSIWHPDILLYNSADEKIDSKFATNIVVYSNGRVTWLPLGLFISSCSINIAWFPFDDQNCSMKFGSWTYDGTKINLTEIGEKIEIDGYQPSGEWDLLNYPAKRTMQYYDCCTEPYIDITFTIHIRRRTLYYGFNLIIPCALISLLTLLTFILPPGEGEKISLGITVLLSLSVTQLMVADMVPATSMAVPLVGVYFACVMIMCTISVITTVVVLNFHHRTTEMYEMPMWVKKIICEWLAWTLRMSRPGHDLSRKFLICKARMRDLESKTPPSVSLIANVKDVDNAIPMTDYPALQRPRTRIFHEHQSPDIDGGRSGNGSVGGGLLSVKSELLAILNELRFITKKMKDDGESEDETNDWKFAALVIDRLCFWIFSIYLVATTMVIFISPSFKDF